MTRLPSLALVSVLSCAALAFAGCPGGDAAGAGEGEGEGDAGEGEGEGEEGEGEEGEGEEGEGEGEEGEGEGEPEGGRTFECHDGEQIATPAECSVAADCVATSVLVDCCGTAQSTGVRADEAGAFAETYQACVALQPICDCEPGPTRGDDGTIGGEGDAANVRCLEGLCSSTFADDTRTLSCASEAPVVVAAQCTDDDDCAFGRLRTDCCGSERVTGIRAEAAASFAADAATCAQAFGDCECAAQPTVGDDGSQAGAFDEEPAVACVDALCVAVF